MIRCFYQRGLKIQKTEEDLQEYIFRYKAETLAEINSETQKRIDQSNQVDIKIGNLLLTLGSAFIAIIGGYILNQDSINNVHVGIIITVIVLSFFVSIIAGLKNYQDVSLFWLMVGEYKHSEGKIIIDDRSKTFNDLLSLREKLDTYRNSSPNKSKDSARAVQIISFLGGVSLLLILMIAKIFS